MKSILTVAAFAGFACGARHFFNFMNQKNKNRLQEKKLEIWEGEGGAVPVAQTRTAAHVRHQNLHPPRPAPGACRC